MNPPVPGWIQIKSKQQVHIPTPDHKGVAEVVEVVVPAWQDPVSGQIFLDGEAHEMMDAVKARYLGILSPDQIKELRHAIGKTQAGMSALLQLGMKTWTRWETGAERPSRSMNILLSAIYDGRLDVAYLETLADSRQRSLLERWRPCAPRENGMVTFGNNKLRVLDEDSSVAA